jgi:BNR repeat-like domain
MRKLARSDSFAQLTRSARMLASLALFIVLLAGCASQDASLGGPPLPPARYMLAGGGACVTYGDHPTPPYQNIRVSADSFAAHSEPMLAENPRNPLNLVGGSKMFTDPAHYQFKIGTYASFDGGCTWSDEGMLPGYDDVRLTSDISAAFDTSGDVYVAVLFNGPGNLSGVGVSKSTDGGRSFANPVRLYTDTSGLVFSDKPWIAVDQTAGPHRGAIYVAWSYDTGYACNGCPQRLGFSRSTDGGKTFSPVQLIEGTAPFCDEPAAGDPPDSRRCDGALGATPAVLPDGTVAIAFGDFDPYFRHPTKMLIVTSRDGGATWSQPTLAATIHDIPYQFHGEKYRNASLPAFACDPKTGRLYLAWADFATGDADILLATSADEGATWTAPVRVNDDPARNGANQFQPALAVAPDGVVSVAYFDTRNDPTGQLIDVYLSQSVDGGASFLPSVRLTPQGWDPTLDAPVDGGGAQFIGDYQGIAADDLYVHPFWNDTSYNTQEILTAAVPSAQPSGH